MQQQLQTQLNHTNIEDGLIDIYESFEQAHVLSPELTYHYDAFYDIDETYNEPENRLINRQIVQFNQFKQVAQKLIQNM